MTPVLKSLKKIIPPKRKGISLLTLTSLNSLWLLTLAVFSACTTTSLPEEPEKIPLQTEFHLPENFAADADPNEQKMFVIPSNVLSIHKIARPKAELRTGPGVQYELLDEMALEGMPSLVIAKIGIWRKVYLPQTETTGWVHYKVLGKPVKNNQVITLSSRRLPKVVAVRPIKRAYNFQNNKELKVRIPKGTAFYQIKEAGTKVLVVLAETNSMVWLAKRDAQ